MKLPQRPEELSDHELLTRLEHELAAVDTPRTFSGTALLRQRIAYIRDLEAQNRKLSSAHGELEQERDRFKALFELAPVGYFVLGNDGCVQDLNLTGAAILWTDASALIGRPFAELVDAPDAERFHDYLFDLLSNNRRRVADFRLRCETSGGIPTRLIGIPYAPEDPQLSECLIAVLDISTEQRLQEQVKEQQESLLRAARLSTVGEVSAGIAHEVGQPLSAIATYAQALRRTLQGILPDDSEPLELVTKLEAQAHRAADILQHIRGLARQRPERSLVDLHDAAGEALQTVAGVLSGSGARVDCQVDTAGPALADPSEIQQVFVNLLMNASDAIQGAGLTDGHIAVRASSPNPEFIQVSIADNGPGFTADVQKQMFKPFFTTKSEGLGLGLALSQAIIEAHGGKLWAEPNAPRGAVFHFTMPAGTRNDV
ncbi:MAG: ATP-binding protein [Gammaproteobacteria bacterium]